MPTDSLTAALTLCGNLRKYVERSEGVPEDDDIITPHRGMPEGVRMPTRLDTLNQLEAALKLLEAEGGEHD